MDFQAHLLFYLPFGHCYSLPCRWSPCYKLCNSPKNQKIKQEYQMVHSVNIDISTNGQFLHLLRRLLWQVSKGYDIICGSINVNVISTSTSTIQPQNQQQHKGERSDKDRIQSRQTFVFSPFRTKLDRCRQSLRITKSI